MSGPSDIQQAVAELAQSLDLGEEASVHANDALTSTGVAFYHYRQAFGDEAQPSQVDVCGKTEKARLNASPPLRCSRWRARPSETLCGRSRRRCN